MIGGALQKVLMLLGQKAPGLTETGSRLGSELLSGGKDLGRAAITGSKWFGGRHPELSAAAGGAGAMGLAQLLGGDEEEDDLERVRQKLALLEGGY